MTSFKIINDDVGLRGIQESNKSSAITGPVQPVKASNPIQKSAGNIPLQASLSERKNFVLTHSQRRHENRRKVDTPVLLETRSSHDRRTKIKKNNDSEHNNAITTLHGIDEIV